MARLKMPRSSSPSISESDKTEHDNSREVKIAERDSSKGVAHSDGVDLSKEMISKIVSSEEYQRLFGSSDEEELGSFPGFHDDELTVTSFHKPAGRKIFHDDFVVYVPSPKRNRKRKAMAMSLDDVQCNQSGPDEDVHRCVNSIPDSSVTSREFTYKFGKYYEKNRANGLLCKQGLSSLASSTSDDDKNPYARKYISYKSDRSRSRTLPQAMSLKGQEQIIDQRASSHQKLPSNICKTAKTLLDRAKSGRHCFKNIINLPKSQLVSGLDKKSAAHSMLMQKKKKIECGTLNNSQVRKKLRFKNVTSFLEEPRFDEHNSFPLATFADVLESGQQSCRNGFCEGIVPTVSCGVTSGFPVTTAVCTFDSAVTTSISQGDLVATTDDCISNRDKVFSMQSSLQNLEVGLSNGIDNIKTPPRGHPRVQLTDIRKSSPVPVSSGEISMSQLPDPVGNVAATCTDGIGNVSKVHQESTRSSHLLSVSSMQDTVSVERKRRKSKANCSTFKLKAVKYNGSICLVNEKYQLVKFCQKCINCRRVNDCNNCRFCKSKRNKAGVLCCYMKRCIAPHYGRTIQMSSLDSGRKPRSQWKTKQRNLSLHCDLKAGETSSDQHGVANDLQSTACGLMSDGKIHDPDTKEESLELSIVATGNDIALHSSDSCNLPRKEFVADLLAGNKTAKPCSVPRSLAAEIFTVSNKLSPIKPKLRSSYVERSSIVSCADKSLPRVEYGLDPLVKLPWPEDSTEDAAWVSGYHWCLTRSIDVGVRNLCFLCGSAGKEKLIFCSFCCEAFHPYCLEISPVNELNWRCDRCKRCVVCGFKANLLMCDVCHDCYHAECLGPFYHRDTVGDEETWVCGRCVRCTKCGRRTPGKRKDSKWKCNFSMCEQCGVNWGKGNFCPVCEGVYNDSDDELKMMFCTCCSKWIHMECENITVDDYEILADLPDSIPYQCWRCHTKSEQTEPPRWFVEVKKELQGRFRKIYHDFLFSRDMKSLRKALVTNDGVFASFDLFDTMLENIASQKYMCVNEFCMEGVQLIKKFSHAFEENKSCFAIAPTCQELVIRFEKLLDDVFPWFSVSKPAAEASKDVRMHLVHHSMGVPLTEENIRCLNMDHCYSARKDGVRSADLAAMVQNRPPNKAVPKLPVEPLIRFSGRTSGECEACHEELANPSFKSADEASLAGLGCTDTVNSEAAVSVSADDHLGVPRSQVFGTSSDSKTVKDHDIGGSTVDTYSAPNTSTHFDNMAALDQLAPGKFRDETLDMRRCLFCNCLGDGDECGSGRLLYAGLNEWVHVNCALWSAEVFEDEHGRLKHVPEALKRGNKLKCEVCDQLGATIGCCYNRCTQNYHFMCAKLDNVVFLDDKKIYCKVHKCKANQELILEDSELSVPRRVVVDLSRCKSLKRLQRGFEPQCVTVYCGGFCIHKLGYLTPVSDGKKCLLPVSYRISRVFWSTKDPTRRCKYSCRVDLVDKPVASAKAESTLSCGGNTIVHDAEERRARCLETDGSLSANCDLVKPAVSRGLKRKIDALACSAGLDPKASSPLDTSKELREHISRDRNNIDNCNDLPCTLPKPGLFRSDVPTPEVSSSGWLIKDSDISSHLTVPACVSPACPTSTAALALPALESSLLVYVDGVPASDATLPIACPSAIRSSCQSASATRESLFSQATTRMFECSARSNALDRSSASAQCRSGNVSSASSVSVVSTSCDTNCRGLSSCDPVQHSQWSTSRDTVVCPSSRPNADLGYSGLTPVLPSNSGQTQATLHASLAQTSPPITGSPLGMIPYADSKNRLPISSCHPISRPAVIGMKDPALSCRSSVPSGVTLHSTAFRSAGDSSSNTPITSVSVQSTVTAQDITERELVVYAQHSMQVSRESPGSPAILESGLIATTGASPLDGHVASGGVLSVAGAISALQKPAGAGGRGRGAAREVEKVEQRAFYENGSVNEGFEKSASLTHKVSTQTGHPHVRNLTAATDKRKDELYIQLKEYISRHPEMVSLGHADKPADLLNPRQRADAGDGIYCHSAFVPQELWLKLAGAGITSFDIKDLLDIWSSPEKTENPASIDESLKSCGKNPPLLVQQEANRKDASAPFNCVSSESSLSALVAPGAVKSEPTGGLSNPASRSDMASLVKLHPESTLTGLSSPVSSAASVLSIVYPSSDLHCDEQLDARLGRSGLSDAAHVKQLGVDSQQMLPTSSVRANTTAAACSSDTGSTSVGVGDRALKITPAYSFGSPSMLSWTFRQPVHAVTEASSSQFLLQRTLHNSSLNSSQLSKSQTKSTAYELSRDVLTGSSVVALANSSIQARRATHVVGSRSANPLSQGVAPLASFPCPGSLATADLPGGVVSSMPSQGLGIASVRFMAQSPVRQPSDLRIAQGSFRQPVFRCEPNSAQWLTDLHIMPPAKINESVLEAKNLALFSAVASTKPASVSYGTVGEGCTSVRRICPKPATVQGVSTRSSLVPSAFVIPPEPMIQPRKIVYQRLPSQQPLHPADGSLPRLQYVQPTNNGQWRLPFAQAINKVNVTGSSVAPVIISSFNGSLIGQVSPMALALSSAPQSVLCHSPHPSPFAGNSAITQGCAVSGGRAQPLSSALPPGLPALSPISFSERFRSHHGDFRPWTASEVTSPATPSAYVAKPTFKRRVKVASLSSPTKKVCATAVAISGSTSCREPRDAPRSKAESSLDCSTGRAANNVFSPSSSSDSCPPNLVRKSREAISVDAVGNTVEITDDIEASSKARARKARRLWRRSRSRHYSLWLKQLKAREQEKLSAKHASALTFVLKNEDGWRSESCSLEDLWKELVSHINDLRMDINMAPFPCSVSDAYDFFGLTKDFVAYLVEQLPGGHHCRNYKFQYHLPRVTEDDKDTPVNPSGCARAEVAVKHAENDMFAWLASPYRVPPNMADELNDDEPAGTQDLPVAMKYRQLKNTVKDHVGVYRSKIHGRGLYCKKPIEAGEMIIEYAGQKIRASLTDRREQFYEKKGYGCYMFRVDDSDVVDATLFGNEARFINHSCDPNCYSRVINVDGSRKIIIFAHRRILVGEELTYDYKFPIEDDKLPCYCGSKKCRQSLN